MRYLQMGADRDAPGGACLSPKAIVTRASTSHTDVFVLQQDGEDEHCRIPVRWRPNLMIATPSTGRRPVGRAGRPPPAYPLGEFRAADISCGASALYHWLHGRL